MKRFHRIFGKFALLAVFIQLLSVGLLYAPRTYADEIEESNIIINEISPSSSPEWVEIFNKGANLVDISGWIIRDATSGKFAEISAKVLSPGEYYTIDKNGSATLNNDDDKVELYNNDTTPTLISQVIYDTNGLTATQTYAFHEELPNLGWVISDHPTKGIFNDFGAPEAIVDLSQSSRTDKKVELSWTYTKPSDFNKFVIEFKNELDDWEDITIQGELFANGENYSWVSNDAKIPGNFTYRILVYDELNQVDDSGSGISVNIEKYQPITSTPEYFAENVQIFAQSSTGGKVDLTIQPSSTNPVEGAIKAFGSYWTINEDPDNKVFNSPDSKINIRIWFKQSDINNENILLSQVYGILYYDISTSMWKPFGDISVVLDETRLSEGYLGYVQAITDHFTEFTAVADIAGPEIRSLTDNSQKDRPYLTYTYNLDDKAGSGISKVELIVDGELKVINNYPDIPQAKTDTISYRVSQNKTYTVILRAYDGVGNITESSPVQTEINVPIPSAPTGLKIEKIDGKYLLSWDDGRGAWVDYYSIYFSTDAVNYSLLDKTNQMSYTIDNLLEGKIYYFKVLASSIGGDSQSSSVAYIAIAGPPVAPVAEIFTTPVAQAAPSPVVTDTEEEDIVPPPANPAEEEVKTDEEKDNTRIIITIIVILLAAGAGIGGYYGYLWWQERIAPENTQVNVSKKPQTKKSSNPKTTKKSTKRSSSRW